MVDAGACGILPVRNGREIEFIRGMVACMAVVVVTQAGATTYNVNEAAGDVSLTGTITTDGAIGSLYTSNITDWNLLAAVGTTTFDFTGPVSGNNSTALVYYGNVPGGDLTATSTGLFFNFGDAAAVGYFFLGETGGISVVCFENATAVCTGTQGINLLLAEQTVNGNIPEVGNVQIGSVSPTPLPAALPLFAGGLGVLGCSAGEESGKLLARSRHSCC